MTYVKVISKDKVGPFGGHSVISYIRNGSRHSKALDTALNNTGYYSNKIYNNGAFTHFKQPQTNYLAADHFCR